MSTDLPLLVRDDQTMTVRITGEAFAESSAALENAALIGRVTNLAEQTEAVEAQKALRTLIKACEDTRVECKAPVLEYGRRIDTCSKSFQEPLKVEELRIATLIGDFQTLELARQRAAEAAARLEAARIEAERVAELRKIAEEEERKRCEFERQKSEALAQANAARTRQEREESERLQADIERQRQLSIANSHAQLDKVNADADHRAASIIVAPMAKTTGQIVREEWDITVTDIWSLARAHPMCVKIEPRLLEIRELLDLGVKVAGVSAKKVVKSGVRTTPERKAISV